MNNQKQVVLSLTKIYGEVCQYCGANYDNNNPVTVDHIIPQQLSKSMVHFVHSIENLLPVCKKCNCKKSNKHYRTFLFNEHGKLNGEKKISLIDEQRVNNNLISLKDLEINLAKNYVKVEEKQDNEILKFPEELKESLAKFFLLEYNYDNYLILEPTLQKSIQAICRVYKSLKEEDKRKFYNDFLLNKSNNSLIVSKSNKTFNNLGKKELGKILLDMQVKNKIKAGDIDKNFPSFIEYVLKTNKFANTEEYGEDYFNQLQKIYILNLTNKDNQKMQNKIKDYLFNKEVRINFDELNKVNFLQREKFTIIMSYIKTFLPEEKMQNTINLETKIIEEEEINKNEQNLNKVLHPSLEKMELTFKKIQKFLEDGWEIEDLEISFKRHKTKFEKY